MIDSWEGVVLLGLTVAIFITEWIKRYKRMGYQPRDKPIVLSTKPVEPPLVYRLDIPVGLIANQCNKCLDVYLIRVPPPFTAEPSRVWLCNDCEAKQKGVYR